MGDATIRPEALRKPVGDMTQPELVAALSAMADVALEWRTRHGVERLRADTMAGFAAEWQRRHGIEKRRADRNLLIARLVSGLAAAFALCVLVMGAMR